MASRNKAPLTLDEHRELGRQLQEMHNLLVRAHVKLANGYPANSKVVNRVARATQALDSLRSELDEQALTDVGDPDWSPRIYYLGPDADRA